ncbi:MAG: DnaD domain protein [Clostridia bacterium]|nr:DnaD domain protein [Clostridia bacterium]
MYKINPNSYASVFALPTDVADKHLRMAGKAQLKVLLWLYRNPATKAEISVISRDTGIPADEIDDAMLYWTEAGLVVKDGDTAAVQTVQSASEIMRENAAKEAVKTEVSAEIPQVRVQKTEKPPIVKPSMKDIAMRLTESEEVRTMFEEAQASFGRTLGYDAQSSLLILHDHYGLPAEVIIMLCSYAKTAGKQGSVAYIMKMGASWSETGIDSFEKASEKIARLENSNRIWTEFRNVTGVDNPKPTSKQADYLEVWVNDYGFGMDMIYYAYEKAVEKKGSISFSYMNGILRSWNEADLRTIADVEESGRRYAGETEKKPAAKHIKDFDPSSANTSFNIDLIMKRSRELDPTKTKKGQ